MSTSFGEELSRNWNVLLGSIIGGGCGIIPLAAAAGAMFMRSIQADFGWTRTELSLSSVVLGVVLAGMAPLVGVLVDRYRTSWIAGGSMVLMAGGWVALSLVGNNLGLYLALFAVTTVIAAGASAVPFARAVSIAFPGNRGKALGLAMIGNGVSGVLLPLYIVPLVAADGWRSGFRALALVAVVAAPIVFGLLRKGERKPGVADAAAAFSPGPDLATVGMTVRQAIASRPFRMLLVIFPLVTLSFAGLQMHFLAMLGDAGLSAQWVAWYASSMGIALTVTRVISGYLLDAFPAQRVCAIIMGLGAASVLVFAFSGTAGSVFGAIAIGLVSGAEIDMLGYFASKYFGFASYGRVYGMLWSTILLTTAVSPILYGLVKDGTGSYTPALVAGAALLGVASLLLLRMARIPYLPTTSGPPAPVGRSDGTPIGTVGIAPVA
ncbi:MFS transporter [Tsukamurella pseudospumae]|uniref:Major facilitator superfamily (MFS) profile domain-containing protein n=1 Tax=Tsukamurella pseudospumae TaxID=239498 RepID=A0A137ZXT4_9ACTN|nr:MFS transporter [Tsukamurella pseudospumae]KXO98334.1 hypothetical protein AXK61_20145 [Tsukamurella pseudospumae]KXP02982.1 hypothetical protein AXK60_13950 [Tsukamurella pseudospumae]